MSHTLVRPILAILALALTGAAHATDRLWPDSAAPCSGTLQACIDGSANGDRIVIIAETIAEDLSIYDKDITLTPSAGNHPAFGPGHWLSITSSAISGDRNVAVSGLSFTDGYVFVNYNGSGTATYDLRGLVIGTMGSGTGNYISVAANHGTVNAMLYNNRVTGLPRSLNNGLIELASHGGTLNASAYYNTLKSTNTVAYSDGGGIFADYAGTGSGGSVKLHGNEVRGSFSRAGIFISEGLFSSTPVEVTARVYSNVVIGVDPTAGDGISFTPSSGTIHAQAVANTITRAYGGIAANQWFGGAASARVDGIFSSNLIRAQVGLSVNAATSPSLTNDYNLINAASNIATLGTHTITADARVISDDAPRLRSDSPAIDAADTATVALGIILNGLPDLDGNGLRRFKGSPTDVDIGAYESGDVTFNHTVNTDNTGSGSYITGFDDPSTNGVPGALALVTSNYNNGTISGVLYSSPFGVYYSNPSWMLFAEDLAPAPLGAHFDVFVPEAGGGSFTHVATPDNSSGSVSRIDNSSTDSLPDRIVLVTQNWTVGASGVYNAHPVGLTYFGKWFVVNLDGADVPVNSGFNVYAQAASPNAFRVSATSATNGLDLDHPLLNGIPCARPHVSRMLGAVTSDYGFDVEYIDDHWRIFGHSSLSVGDQFNVVIDPAQVAACSDRIFANGFE